MHFMLLKEQRNASDINRMEDYLMFTERYFKPKVTNQQNFTDLNPSRRVHFRK